MGDNYGAVMVYGILGTLFLIFLLALISAYLYGRIKKK
jgi:hypothetical protein